MIVDDASIIEEEYSQEPYYDSHTQIMMQGSRKGSSQNKSDTVSAIDNFEPWIINILYEILLLLVQVYHWAEKEIVGHNYCCFLYIFSWVGSSDWHVSIFWFPCTNILIPVIHDMMLCHLNWGMYDFILFSNDNWLRIRIQDKIAISYLVLSKFQDELCLVVLRKTFIICFTRRFSRNLCLFILSNFS